MRCMESHTPRRELTQQRVAASITHGTVLTKRAWWLPRRPRRRRRQRIGRARQLARLAPRQRIQERYCGRAEAAQCVRARAAVLPGPEALVHALCSIVGVLGQAELCKRAGEPSCTFPASGPRMRHCCPASLCGAHGLLPSMEALVRQHR